MSLLKFLLKTMFGMLLSWSSGNCKQSMALKTGCCISSREMPTCDERETEKRATAREGQLQRNRRSEERRKAWSGVSKAETHQKDD